MIRRGVLSIILALLVGCGACSSLKTGKTSRGDHVVTQKEAIKASVLVEYGKGSGSGFVIDTFLSDKGDERCYKILTAAHVLKAEYYDPRFPKPFVTFTLDGDTQMFQADISVRDPGVDVALLTVWTYETTQLCLPFKITKDDSYLEYDKDVYLISFPQGLGPMLTKGIISGISILEWSDTDYTTTAQSAPGSSGGALIDPDTGEVVGLLKAVMSQPFSPHLFGWASIIAPAEDIRPIAYWKPGSPVIVPQGSRGDTPKQVLIFYPKNN